MEICLILMSDKQIRVKLKFKKILKNQILIHWNKKKNSKDKKSLWSVH